MSPTVSGTVTDQQGNATSWSASWAVTDPTPKVSIGMSAPANIWDQRLAEVGAAGITSRRIFADLTSTGRDQQSLVDEAVAAGMRPVLSYKLPRLPADQGGGYRISEALAGTFDGWVNSLGIFLASKNAPIEVTFHHEPRGDLSPAQFIALQKRYIPLVRKSANIECGIFLNGWLLDGSTSAKAEFASYTDSDLLDMLDWFGIDAYHEGTPEAPNATKTPGNRIRLTRAWLDARGRQSMPIGIGEYNGHTAAAVADAGEAALSVGGMRFCCVWNSTAGEYIPLSSSRLAAFQTTKADPRAQQ